MSKKSTTLFKTLLNDNSKTTLHKLVASIVYALDFVPLTDLYKYTAVIEKNCGEAERLYKVDNAVTFLVNEGFINRGATNSEYLYPKFLADDSLPQTKTKNNTTNSVLMPEDKVQKTNNKNDTKNDPAKDDYYNNHALAVIETNWVIGLVKEQAMMLGINPSISKSGIKQIHKIRSYITELWKNPQIAPPGTKYDLYKTYIKFVANKMESNFTIKSLVFRKNKNEFETLLKLNTLKKEENKLNFNPKFFTRGFSVSEFYGIRRGIIPKNVKESNYWPTLYSFLLKRVKDEKPYPICKQVLVALERIIIYKLFLKEDATELIALHRTYKAKYNKAALSKTLDDLAKFVSNEKTI